MKSLIAMAALMATATLGAAPANAQSTAAPAATAQPAGAQAGAQKDKQGKSPIDITSDQAVTHNSDCTVIWSGSAEALQDTARLRSDVMIAHLEVKKDKPPATGGASNNDCGQMISLEAKGNVYYLSADGRRVHGDNAFYEAANTTITITGDVTAVEDQNVLRGTKMVYNTQTGEGYVEGAARGAGAKNRPRGVFYPKNSDDSADDTSSDAKPKKKAAK